MKIRKFTYTPKDVDCRYCVKFKRGQCRAPACEWLAERIEAGIVDYHEALADVLAEHANLRLRAGITEVTHRDSMWKNEEHHRRFQSAQAIFGFRKKRNTPAYYAALYLLTSGKDLFRRTADCFCKNRIDFNFARLRGISVEDYTLYKIAKSLYLESSEVSVDELADPDLVDGDLFHLVVNALLIRRFGLSVLHLKNGGDYYGNL